MAAIQSVLVEHNVKDARFILELPSTPAAASTVVTAVHADAPGTWGAGNASSVTAPVDSSAPSTEGGVTTATLLMGMQTTPAAVPTPPPEHQRPPPRARSPSERQRSPASYHSESLQGHALPAPSALHSGSPPLNDSISSLGATARPAPVAAVGDASGTQMTPSAAAEEGPVNTILAQPPAQPHPPPPRSAVDAITSDGSADVLTGEAAAEICRVSNQLAHDIAVAEAQMSRKEILQKFVGRSVILEDRRQREAQQLAQASTMPWNGIPHPAVPFKADAASAHTKASSQPRRGIPTAATKPPAQKLSADPTIPSGSVASAFSPAVLSPPPPEPQQPQRRSIVRLTPPSRTPVHSGDNGARGSVLSDSSSLPSLVSAKKSAVPGKTPVFSILNKDGSRLLDQGGAAMTLRTSLSGALAKAGGACVAAAGAATNGGDATEASRSSSNSNSNNTSISHIRQSRPSSVSLLADDRAPPSPVHEPLLGVAAEEEANRQRSILMQTQPRSPTPEPQPVESAINRDDGEVLRKMLSEQSKNNTRRALQLQNQSRLSHTTQMAATPVIGKNQPSASGTFSTASTPRSPSRPSTSAAAASSQPSLRAMLQEQRQLQDASRRSMEEHNRLMQAARAARTPASASSNAFETSKIPAVRLATPPAHATPAATGAAAAAPVTVQEDDAAHRKPGIATLARASSPGRNTNGTFTPSTSGIQVVKFTLPHEEEARQAAVQQLCRSSSGTQHLDTKDRYRALLAEQQNEFTAQEAKAQDYKVLLNRAVEFNRFQQQQRTKPS
ncbi:hypothetical protein, conserved [Leishmania donovani]|uniref:Uncharacterized protein n=1 Tax=Leishmania donovani TaxID=5661 RepID=E9BD52_LEIDO|nr:hypothetical protein, conserved [Leishmania donovani]CBZ33178.1 hypothetical protein, conserved [Leishmania donovani]